MSTTARNRPRPRTLVLSAALAILATSCSLLPGQGDDAAGPNDEVSVGAVES